MNPGSMLQVVKEKLMEGAKSHGSAVWTVSDDKSARWEDSVDYFKILRKAWHAQLLFHTLVLMTLASESHNPLHVISALAQQGADDELEGPASPRNLAKGFSTRPILITENENDEAIFTTGK